MLHGEAALRLLRLGCKRKVGSGQWEPLEPLKLGLEAVNFTLVLGKVNGRKTAWKGNSLKMYTLLVFFLFSWEEVRTSTGCGGPQVGSCG